MRTPSIKLLDGRILIDQFDATVDVTEDRYCNFRKLTERSGT